MNKRASWTFRMVIILLLAWLSLIPIPESANGLTTPPGYGQTSREILPPMLGPASAGSIDTTSAILNCNLVSLNGATAVNVFFEYGTTTGYGKTTAVQAMTAPELFSANITGLAPNKTYHFRAKADGGDAGITVGADKTFTTLKAAGTFPMWQIAIIAGAIIFVAAVVFFAVSRRKSKPKPVAPA